MVPGLRPGGRRDPACRDAVRREQPPHRRVLLQGAGARLAPSGRDRSAPRGRRALDQGSPGGRRVTIAIIDYGSGNLRSAAKAFERAVAEAGLTDRVLVTGDPQAVLAAERVVLPGVGAFADCRRGLDALPGMVEALTERVLRQGAPFLGICVGMQLMADWGREHGDHRGLGWIPGEVVPLAPSDPSLKVPHMGWNDLRPLKDHPVLAGLPADAHGYFVHSFRFACADPANEVARVDYGGPIAAVIGRDNLLGTQFHPEKSQAIGLALITNFVRWRP
ncbi:MAG: imidazole glycerol phosphate synthase subunit HisH [Alphaproteobacteria bacterium]|nr:imidazole glycerol phosphate synthase subunit HisH [Alphaproteobacteria bacterium]